MLMFREEKSPEDEIKAWQFWHGRQHSVKQRILDAGKDFCYYILTRITWVITFVNIVIMLTKHEYDYVFVSIVPVMLLMLLNKSRKNR